MSVSTLADLLAAPRLGASIDVAAATGAAATSWARIGTQLIPASTPGAALTDDSTSLFLLHALSGKQKFLRACAYTCSSNAASSSLRLWDRLVGVGSIDPTSTGDKTVNSTALTRFTDAGGVQVWLEVQVAPSTTAIVCSMSSYTDQSGGTAHAGATVTFPSATLGIGNFVGPMPMQAGDRGVKSIETLNIATASGGTTARLIVWLVRPLLMAHAYDQLWTEREFPIPFANAIILPDGASVGGASIGLAGTETHRLELNFAVL